MLELHARRDAEIGIEPVFLSYFDKGEPAGSPFPSANYHGLGIRGMTSLGEARRKFAQAAGRVDQPTVVYHSCWGTRLFGPVDGSTRRIAMIHNSEACFGEFLQDLVGWFDGLLCSSANAADDLMKYLPELSRNRIGFAAVPLNKVFWETPRQPLIAGGPLALGYAGRIEKIQKRLDRLPEFLRVCDSIGLPVTFEVVGEGTYEPALRQALASDRRVNFRGKLEGQAYVDAVSRWSASVYFSDYEGGPIGLLEPMARGVIPFFPALTGSFADRYAPQVDPVCHYPPGNMLALAEAICLIFTKTPDEIAALRDRSAGLVLGHTEEIYHGRASDFIRKIQGLPRISEVSPKNAIGFPSTSLPLGLVSRSHRRLLSAE